MTQVMQGLTAKSGVNVPSTKPEVLSTSTVPSALGLVVPNEFAQVFRQHACDCVVQAQPKPKTADMPLVGLHLKNAKL